METTHMTETVEIFDSLGASLFKAPAYEAIEWVVMFPVRPHMVKLEGTKERMSVDDWLFEVDLLNEML